MVDVFVIIVMVIFLISVLILVEILSKMYEDELDEEKRRDETCYDRCRTCIYCIDSVQPKCRAKQNMTAYDVYIDRPSICQIYQSRKSDSTSLGDAYEFKYEFRYEYKCEFCGSRFTSADGRCPRCGGTGVRVGLKRM